jgi:hypothetical protein
MPPAMLPVSMFRERVAQTVSINEFSGAIDIDGSFIR